MARTQAGQLDLETGNIAPAYRDDLESALVDDGAAIPKQLLARFIAALFIFGGLLTYSSAIFPSSDLVNRPMISVMATLGIIAGIVTWLLPWSRWPRSATLVLTPLAQLLIGIGNHFDPDPYVYAVFFMVPFVWVGLGYRRWTSLLFVPSLIVAYLLPLWTRGIFNEASALSILVVLPFCVLIAELISWCTERLQHAQQQLSGSEARYRSLIEKVSVVIYSRSLTDPLGWTYASPRIVNLTGRTAEQWLRHGTWSAALHHADRDAVLRSWHACHSARTPWEAEYRVVQPDGTVIWLHDQAEIVYNEAGDPESWQGLLDNVTERRTLQDRIHHQAYHDPLTGLSNRAFFEERMQRVRLDDGVTGLLFIDLDDFKQINDELGHEVGDEYLVLVASRLREVLRDDDVISRIGGDEFTILLERLPDPTEAEHVAERIMDVLRPPVVLNGRVIFPSASVGVATTASGRFDQPAALLRAADMAMYQAKHRGKCAVVVFAGE